ncbi:MAG: trypsin-like peptidase domain-containing protein [Chthoniobacteraceae bacterium]|jgi:S1-C subfamily serine protease
MTRYRAGIFFLCSIALAAPCVVASAQSAAPGPTISPQLAHDLLHEIDDAFVAVFEKVAPAVVVIEAEKKPAPDDQNQNFDYYFHSPEGDDGNHAPVQEPPVRSEGSGFIVRPDGYIYTNYHVIEDSEKVEVRLRDNRRFIARIVGADPHTDIAVLKIDATNLPTAALLDSDTVRVGQMCFAIGIPYNLDYSFCRGVVSAKGRGNLTSSLTNLMYEDYIQTDAMINPGNSGGPLFDIDGNVIGMNTLINGLDRGLAFAIPSNMLNEIGGELIATGHASHPWLGISVQSVEDEPSAADRFPGVAQGVCVDTIEANAPAYKSDLRPMDVILKVDGVPVASSHDLQIDILRKKVGQSVDLNVWRDGKTFDIAIVTDELPADLSKIAEEHYKAKIRPSDDTSYGLEFGGEPQPAGDKPGAGAAVTAVQTDSPAGRVGIRPGDIVVAVDQKPVADSAACLDLLAAHRGPTGPLLFLIRDGNKARVVLDTAGSGAPQTR